MWVYAGVGLFGETTMSSNYRWGTSCTAVGPHATVTTDSGDVSGHCS